MPSPSIKINVKEYAGAHAVTLSAGSKVLDLVQPLVESGTVVTLDFSGVAMVNVTFFNAIFGPLVRSRDPKVLRSQILCSNLPDATLAEIPYRVAEREWRMLHDSEFRRQVSEATAHSMRSS